jgi:hypothetical protein
MIAPFCSRLDLTDPPASLSVSFWVDGWCARFGRQGTEGNDDMKVKHEEVEFRISRRILWVGSTAYPLPHVSSVRSIEVIPRRGRILMEYGRRAGATVVVGVVGLTILACLGKAVPPVLAILFTIGVLGVLVWHTVDLVRWLQRGRLYVLRVSVAGSQHRALVSRDQELIEDLTRRVVDAIDNPAAEFEIRVENLEIIGGDKYGGDHVMGDKYVDERP